MKMNIPNQLIKLMLIFLISVLLCACNRSVKIGDQEWMSENLDVKEFRNGDKIFHAKTDKEWQKAGEEQKPAWCYYDNNSSNGRKYGKLYNFYAVKDSRGLAPEGWHIPTANEWEELIQYLGGACDAYSQLRSTYGWKEGWNGSQSCGFDAFPGGCRSFNGGFDDIGKIAFFWSSTGTKYGNAYVYYLQWNRYSVVRYGMDKSRGMYVRCLKNETNK